MRFLILLLFAAMPLLAKQPNVVLIMTDGMVLTINTVSIFIIIFYPTNHANAAISTTIVVRTATMSFTTIIALFISTLVSNH